MPLARLPILDVDKVLAALPTAPLDSSSLDAKPVSVPFDEAHTFESGGLPNLLVDLSGSVQISLFNSPDDVDPDGILLRPDVSDAFGTLTPAVTLSGDRAWLKYRADAVLKSSSDHALGAGFAVVPDVDASVGLTDYRVHPRSTSVQDAVRADLAAGPRFALVLADVARLAPGDAVSLQVGGILKVRLKLAWSDMFTGECAALTAVLKSSAGIALEFDAGAMLTADIAVCDDFLVVFSRVDDGTWQVGVKKADTRSLTLGVEAGIEVTFADPAAVAVVVSSVVDDVLKVPVDKVQSAQVQQSMAAAIEKLAKSKIAAAFHYEYQRVDTSTQIFQGRLSTECLNTFHNDLIRGNLQPVLAAILDGRPGIVLERFLHENTAERTESWGFTLGIATWWSISGLDTRTITPVVREDIHGQRQESYMGLRSYQGTWGGSASAWSGDFNAQMDGFAHHPLVSQFSFGLHLLWRQKLSRLSEGDVDVFLDAAVLWGAMAQADAADARARLVKHVGHASDATVQITIADDGQATTFRRLLTAVQAAPAMAAALAAAMPWQSGSLATTQVAIRRSVYAPLWQMYLDSPDILPSQLAASANHFFATSDYPDLGRSELNYEAARPFTFAGLVELNGDTRGAAAAFRQAFDVLRTSIANGAPSQPTLSTAFRDLSAFWAQSHHLRAAGAYVLEAARTAGFVDQVKRAATFASDGTVVVFG